MDFSDVGLKMKDMRVACHNTPCTIEAGLKQTLKLCGFSGEGVL
jgi:hypothetical protein